MEAKVKNADRQAAPLLGKEPKDFRFSRTASFFQATESLTCAPVLRIRSIYV